MSMTVSTADDLRDEFVKLRKAGFSYRAIGEKFGLSHERVRQVTVKGEDPSEWSRKPSRDKRQDLIEEIASWLDENGPVARDTVLSHFELSSSRLTQLIAEGLPSHQMLVTSRPNDVQFSDEEIDKALRRAWAEVQRLNPGATGLSHVMYERVRQGSDPSSSLLVARFGWEHACKAAGVPSGFSMRPKSSYATRWTDEQILAKVAEYVEVCAEARKRPSYLGYDRWQQWDSEAPSGTLVRNRMRDAGIKTWPDIVMTATRSAA